MTHHPSPDTSDARDLQSDDSDAPAKGSAGPREEVKEPARLSMTQIVASGLAAVSTTVLLSFFGVAGTIIGAGLASVLTVVANFLYTRSIEKTHAQLKPVVGTIQAKTATARLATTRGRGATATAVTIPLEAMPADAGAATPDEGAANGTPDGGPDGEAADPAQDEGTDPPPRNPWLRLVDRYGKGKVLTATAAALFVVVMGVVLVVELAIGKPISDAVRGEEGTGTSISQLHGGSGDADPVAPTAPAEDPANVPGDDAGTGEQPTTGTSGETTVQQPEDATATTGGTTTEEQGSSTGDTTDDTTGGVTSGTSDGTTDGSTDGSAGDGTTGDSTGGTDTSTDGGTTEGGTDGGSTDTGTDSGSTGTDGGSGTAPEGGGADTSTGTSSGSGPGSTLDGGAAPADGATS